MIQAPSLPSARKMIDTSPYNKMLEDALHKAAASDAQAKPSNDYSSLGNMTLEQKLHLIKTDFKFDPSQMSDPRDSLNTYLYRWGKYSQDVEKNLLDYKGQKDLDARAGDFYDKYLVPTYKRLGVPLFTKDKWVNAAYTIGKNWDIDHQYANHFSYGAATDAYSLGSRVANAASSLVSLAGALISPPKEITDDNWKVQRDTSLGGGFSLKGFFQDAETLSDSQHLFDAKAVRERLTNISNNMEIMKQLRPMRGFTENAGAFTMEAVPFIALNAIAPPVAAEAELTSLGLSEAPMVEEGGLAGRIMSNTGALAGSGLRGKLAEAALRGGAEGLMYGTLTRPTQDKNKAFEDAAEWAIGSAAITAVAHPLGKLAGRLIGQLGKRVIPDYPSSALEHIPRRGGYSTEVPPERALPSGDGITRMEGEYVGEPSVGELTAGSPEAQIAEVRKQLTQQQKMLTDGREPIGPFEQQELSEAGVAETVAAHGGAAQEIINNAAAAHLIKMQESGMTALQIYKHESELFKNGTPETRDMLDAVMRIRGAIGDRNLSGLSKTEKANLVVQLQTLTKNSATRMLKYMPGLQAALRRRITSYPTAKLDLTLVKHLIPDVMSTLPQGANQAQIAEAIKNRLADLVVEGHKYADEQVSTDAVGKAIQAGKQRKAYVQKNPPPSGWTEKTRRTTSSKGEPGVSYSYNPEWKVYAKRAITKGGKKWTNADIKDWVDGLDDDDFAADIHGYFLPEFLKNIDLRFERKGGNLKGFDYTNLYTFAWNFRHQMPTQYAERLEEELMHSPKMSRFYDEIRNNPKLSSTEKQKQSLALVRKQALRIWNHVDNFLNSGHFGKESNIYASTNSYANDPTIWQDELFNEREEYENNIIDHMFKRATPENEAAKKMIKVMMASRRQAASRGEHMQVKMLSEAIQKRMLTPGPRGGKPYAAGRVRSPLGEVSITEHRELPIQEARTLESIAQPRTQEEITNFRKFTIESAPLRKAFDEINKQGEAAANYLASATPKTAEEQEKFELTRAEIRTLQGRLNAVKVAYQNLRAKYPKDLKEMPMDVSRGPYGAVITDAQGRASVWFNRRAMSELMSTLQPARQGETVEAAARRHAGTMGFNMGAGPDVVAQVMSNVDNSRLPTAAKYSIKQLLTKAFLMAGPEGINVIRAGRPAQDAINTFHEEWTHGWQRTLGERAGDKSMYNIYSHLDADHFDKLHDLMPAKVDEYLKEAYPNVSKEERVVEATAKLICKGPTGFAGGASDRFQISEGEAVNYLYEYFSMLMNKHGDDALDSLTTATGVAKKLREGMVQIARPGAKLPESTRIGPGLSYTPRTSTPFGSP